MDFSSPQVVAAIIAGIVAILTAAVTALITLRIAEKRASVDEKLARLRGEIDQDLAQAKAKFDMELTAQKAQLDNKTVFAAERVAHELMMDPEWRWRSFEVIKHHLGGFENDELRQILVRAGAIRTKSKDGKELWGLLDRNRDNVGVINYPERPGYRNVD
jgi:hypothetical protein